MDQFVRWQVGVIMILVRNCWFTKWVLDNFKRKVNFSLRKVLLCICRKLSIVWHKFILNLTINSYVFKSLIYKILIDWIYLIFLSNICSTSLYTETYDRLKQAAVPIVNSNKCIENYQKYYVINPEIMICAGYSEGGHDSCQVLYVINWLLTKKLYQQKNYEVMSE